MTKARRVMVFCNTLDSCRATEHFLREKDIHTCCYHGDIPLDGRRKAIQEFTGDPGMDGQPVLVCTDLAARCPTQCFDHHMFRCEPGMPSAGNARLACCTAAALKLSLRETSQDLQEASFKQTEHRARPQGPFMARTRVAGQECMDTADLFMPGGVHAGAWTCRGRWTTWSTLTFR